MTSARDAADADLFEEMRPPCDTALIILQSALDRCDGTLLPFRPHDTDRTQSAVAKLLRRDWVQLVPVSHFSAPAWVAARGGRPAQTLVITPAGLDGLNLERRQWPAALRSA